MNFQTVLLARGSSPLTRGKLNRTIRPFVAFGLIPAHAGKTSRHAFLVRIATAHPRSRGENAAALPAVAAMAGSSPLTRGKQAVETVAHVQIRLIPAHAGKTPERTRSLARSTAHPRSRGENPLMKCLMMTRRGSSPLTRGKRKAITGEDADFGLIPAHAGKTMTVTSSVSAAWAHPRSRGENQSSADTVTFVPGSSPLTRGKRQRWRVPWCPWRLIPAHAGKTC